CSEGNKADAPGPAGLVVDTVSAHQAMLKEIKIADIVVRSRHRRNMGDLTTLADSIRQKGLLQPIGQVLEAVQRPGGHGSPTPGSRVGQVCFPSRPSKKTSGCAFLQ